jgi:hypothetical protein
VVRIRRGALVLIVSLAALGASVAAPAGVSAATPTASAATPRPVLVACTRGYYKNVSGHCVKRPGSSPVGATARCRDGSYSYSEHASGTCSHHGGVARWINHP